MNKYRIKGKKPSDIPTHAKKWNEFISFAVTADYSQISEHRRDAVLVFLYYNEISNGGHSSFFACYPDIDPTMILRALEKIGATVYKRVFVEALQNGLSDEYVYVDNWFGTISPPLVEILQNFVISHYNEILPNGFVH